MKQTDNKYKTASAQVIIEYLVILAAIILFIAICTGAFKIGVVKGLENVQTGMNNYVQQE